MAVFKSYISFLQRCYKFLLISLGFATINFAGKETYNVFLNSQFAYHRWNLNIVNRNSLWKRTRVINKAWSLKGKLLTALTLQDRLHLCPVLWLFLTAQIYAHSFRMLRTGESSVDTMPRHALHIRRMCATENEDDSDGQEKIAVGYGSQSGPRGYGVPHA